jgi:steroid 5-alpha reductase family enzyme
MLQLIPGFILLGLNVFFATHYFIWDNPETWTIGTYWLMALNISWISMLIGWLGSLYKKRVDHVDVYWGLTILNTAMPAYLAHTTPLHSAVFLTLLLWSVRLQIQIYAKQGPQEDKRYQGFRQHFGAERYWWFSFYQVFLLQGFLLVLVNLPTQILLLQPMLSPLIFVGLFITWVGIIYEGIADYQLYRHKKNHSGIYTNGLFRTCRHPNYFGEMLVWLGMTVALLTQMPSWFEAVLALLAFSLITYLLVKVSGVRMTHDIMIKREGYQSYAESTPALIPDFRRLRLKDFI